MKLITLYLPESYLRALDELVKKRYYPSRAEAIRVAIRDLLNREFWGRHDQRDEAKGGQGREARLSGRSQRKPTF